jgi:hypothetical protein
MPVSFTPQVSPSSSPRNGVPATSPRRTARSAASTAPEHQQAQRHVEEVVPASLSVIAPGHADRDACEGGAGAALAREIARRPRARCRRSAAHSARHRANSAEASQGGRCRIAR